MLSSSSLLLRSAAEVAKGSGSSSSSGGSVPSTLTNAVIRSLYRRLYREAHRLDMDPMAKVLFPCSAELQEILKIKRPLYVPDTQRYVDVVRSTFRNTGKPGNIKLAFDTLNRLRTHSENVKTKLPAVMKERDFLLEALAAATSTPGHQEVYRAAALTASPGAPQYVPATPHVPSRVVLRDSNHVELNEGTVLVAHPLSSTHVDRRVLLITERTPLTTSAVVLDLQFVFPLSEGHPMFPEVFWGHDVYDGGFNQIGFTMPPTAQVVVLHTLEPAAEAVAPPPPPSAQQRWLSWREQKPSPPPPEQSKLSALSSKQHHERLCRPLIPGGALENGEHEPTLYISGVEALPYLATLAPCQPRASVRLYWGSMRWTTAQIETEVANGHWFPINVSPSFFRPYDLAEGGSDSGDAEGLPQKKKDLRFPTEEELLHARRMRERRHGVNATVPQVFPANQPLRRRELLWDELMFALGGEYTSLVGGANPFTLQRGHRASPTILAPLYLQQGSRTASPSASLPDAPVESLLDVENDEDEEGEEDLGFVVRMADATEEEVVDAADIDVTKEEKEDAEEEEDKLPTSHRSGDPKE